VKLLRTLIRTSLFSFLCTSFGSYSETKPLCFDKLFLETPLESVFDQCMHIQHELELYGAARACHDAEPFIDALIGKLFHLASCIQSMRDNNVHVYQDDADYLIRIVEHMRTCFSVLFSDGVPVQGNHVLTLLKTIKQGLALLQ